MSEKKILLAVDVGNSLTKANWGTSPTKHFAMEQNNEFFVTDIESIDNSEIPFGVEESDVVENALPKSIHFVLESENEELKHFLELPVKVYGGTDAVIQHEHTVQRPAMGSKVDQRTTYYSIFSMLYRISRILDVDEMAVKLGVCLPLADVDIDKDLLELRLLGTHYISGDTKVKVNIEKQFSIGECFASSVSMLFTMTGKRKEKLDPALSNGKYIVVNIGAGTTDVALFNNVQFVEGSKDTFNIGGNTIREMLISDLNRRFRYRISVQSAEEAVKTGKIRIGANVIDVLDTVIDIKKKFSLQLMDNIKRYLIQISQPLQELSAVVCVGGGALEGEYTNDSGNSSKILSTASYISNYVQENAQFTKVIVHSNPRYADADGCWIILCAKQAQA